MANYQQRSHLFGDVQAELVDSRHLRLHERRPFARPRSFMVDVACIAPNFPVERPRAGAWLITALASGIGAAIAFWLALGGTPLAWSLGTLLALIAVVTGAVFRVRGAPTLVLATRHAGVPLLRIRPYRRGDASLAPFLDILRVRIAEADTKRGLTPERLRSGEIKTLRRLASENVLSEGEYEKAKQAVLLAST
ncbi:MAG: hypothetical protein AB7U81_01230 [Thiohalomonadaceae bacterium]